MMSEESEESEMKNRKLMQLRGNRTYTEFAKLLGIDYTSLNDYEHGRHEPSYATWVRMKRTAKENGIDLPDDIFCEGIKKEDEVEVVLATFSLKTVRDYLGLSCKQMGEMMGVSESGYFRYENGDREPLASAWLKIKYRVQSYGIQLLENPNA
jgi:DNA-binding XRE family transcriptional regulator